MTPSARTELAKIRGEVSDLFLAAGIPLPEHQIDALLEQGIEAVAEAFVRYRAAHALGLPTALDLADGEEEEED
jgi:hypothetical protein